MQENDNSFPLEKMIAVDSWSQVPHNARINKLARNFPVPERKMERKAENDFMAGCVRFWVWFPAAASCTHKKDSMYGVSPNCTEYPRLILELDPDGWNNSLPAGYAVTAVLGGPRN
jgi:hypothetical protein